VVIGGISGYFWQDEAPEKRELRPNGLGGKAGLRLTRDHLYQHQQVATYVTCALKETPGS